MNNEGFELIDDLVPVRYSRILRAVIRRVFLVAKAVRYCAFRIWYPLPQVILFESELKGFLPSNFPISVLNVSQSKPPASQALLALETLFVKTVNQAKVAFIWMRALITQQTSVLVIFSRFNQISPDKVKLGARNLYSSVVSEFEKRVFFMPAGRGTRYVLLASGTSPEDIGFVDRYEAKDLPQPEYLLIDAFKNDVKLDPYPLPGGTPPPRLNLRDHILKFAADFGTRPRPPLIQFPENHEARSIGSSFRFEKRFGARLWHFGIGDVLMGAALLHQEAQRTGRLAFVDWSRTVGKEFLAESNLATLYEPDTESQVRRMEYPIAHQINANFPIDFAFHVNVFTNRRPLKPLDESTRRFLYESFSPIPEVWQEVNKYLERNQLGIEGYSAVHVRFGDYETLKPPITETLLLETSRILDQDGEFILLSDHPRLLKKFKGLSKVRIRDHAETHSGLLSNPLEFGEMLADFVTIAYSKECYSLSRYAWGSAFSEIACDIFNVPFKPVVAKVVVG